MGPRTPMPKAKLAAYGLVRRADGTPRIDGEPNRLPLSIKLMLTDVERKDLKVELK